MVKLHGRWCGPNWTNNQVIAARDYLLSGGSFKTKCDDKLDCACREHDRGCASSELGCSFDDDTRLMRKAQAILNNPLYSITNPSMYAAAAVVANSMAVIRWTRSR